jgi:hypothetical protein
MVGMVYLRMSRIEDPAVAMDGWENNPFGGRWKRGAWHLYLDSRSLEQRVIHNSGCFHSPSTSRSLTRNDALPEASWALAFRCLSNALAVVHVTGHLEYHDSPFALHDFATRSARA